MSREVAPLEREITDGILRMLRAQPTVWCFKVLGGGGQMRGVPDIVGCCGDKFFALEVKRPKVGRVSPIQRSVMRRIADAGGLVAVVRSVDEAKEVLGIDKRGGTQTDGQLQKQ